MFPGTLPRNGTRSDAAREYVLLHWNRPNLMALIEQKVKRVLVYQDVSPPPAQGAEFGSQGQKFVVYAKHEVLLATGALASPLPRVLWYWTKGSS